MAVRLGLGRLVGFFGLDGRFAPLDQLHRFFYVNFLGLRLSPDSVPAYRLRILLFEIDEESLLLRRAR